MFEKPDGKAKHSIQLNENLLKVDTSLKTFLTPDFIKHFRDDVKLLELPKDNPLPFVLFIDREIMILWAATDSDYDIWTSQIQQY